jgi:hypothetical protein
MKTRFTVIIRDNDRKENVMELNAHGYTIRLDTHYGRDPHVKLNLDADVELVEPGEKAPNVYELDEEITQEIVDCSYGHSLVTKMGLLRETTYCEKCGLEIKIDAL